MPNSQLPHKCQKLLCERGDTDHSQRLRGTQRCSVGANSSWWHLGKEGQLCTQGRKDLYFLNSNGQRWPPPWGSDSESRDHQLNQNE